MRLEISKRTDIALKALFHLEAHEAASRVEVAEAVDTTANYLPQVLRPLVSAGFICSTPGPGGGYRLCVDLEAVSILDVIETIEGGLERGACVLRGTPCPPTEQCAMHEPWTKARDAMLAELRATSVAAALQSS